MIYPHWGGRRIQTVPPPSVYSCRAEVEVRQAGTFTFAGHALRLWPRPLTGSPETMGQPQSSTTQFAPGKSARRKLPAIAQNRINIYPLFTLGPGPEWAARAGVDTDSARCVGPLRMCFDIGGKHLQRTPKKARLHRPEGHKRHDPSI